MVGARLRALRILHVYFLAVLAGFGAIAYVLPKPKVPPAGLEVLIYVLAGVGLIELLVVLPVLRAKQMPPRERVGDGRDLDLSAKIEGKLATAFTRLMSASILTWALCTSVAIYGLIASFLWGDPRLYVPFGAAAALAMIIWGPSRTLIEEVVRAARRDG